MNMTTPPTSPSHSGVPRSSRPFSPSPARDSRHTASRPPSLLFGTPTAPGLVATSSSFSLAGLPPTPPAQESIYNGLSRRAENAADGLEQSLRDSSAHMDTSMGSIPEQDRRESISSTSSASPPLGASSILSALADLPILQDSITESSSMPTLSRTSESRHIQENTPYASTSKSMPRLHQPTVIRRTSGPGIAFLPPPVHVSNSIETFSIHQPRPKRYSMPSRPSADILESNLRLRSTSPGEGSDRAPRPLSTDFEQIRAFFESASTSHQDSRSPLEDHDRIRASILSPGRSGRQSSKSRSPVHDTHSSDEERRVLHEVPDKTSDVDETSEVDQWLPPYKPRKSCKSYPGPSKSSNDRLAVTLYAGIPPPRHDALPYRMTRLEVALAWGEAERLAWLPLRWLFPVDWRVRLVHGELDPDQQQGLVRVVVKSVVRRLPVLCRLAAYL